MGKLIRDKIPEIIRASGRTAEVRRLDDRAYLAALHNKLVEETAELRNAVCPDDILEEAADVLEVLSSIVASHGHTVEDIVRTAIEKRSKHGGFDKRFSLENM